MRSTSTMDTAGSGDGYAHGSQEKKKSNLNYALAKHETEGSGQETIRAGEEKFSQL